MPHTNEQYFKIYGELYLRVVFKYDTVMSTDPDVPHSLKVDIDNMAEIKETLEQIVLLAAEVVGTDE